MPTRYLKLWENFGPVLKEGLYEDYARRDTLLGLSRFKTTDVGRRMAIVERLCCRLGLKENQTAIYYATGNDLDRLATSPQLEGFRARGIEVLLLADQVDSFLGHLRHRLRGQALQVRHAGLWQTSA